MPAGNTTLEPKYTAPFDEVYALVTADLTARADGKPDPEGPWLGTLINTFQLERKHWETDPNLERYRRRWRRLWATLLRLSAGAYLHVSYDLPRAMANDWPGTGAWTAGPNDREAFALFTEIKEVFDENFYRSVKRRDIVGIPSYALRFTSRRVLRVFVKWLHDLRRGAWEHARILAQSDDRPLREATMRDAMASALEDASTIFPWSAAVLDPPDAMARSSPVATGIAALAVIADYIPLGLSLVALLISLSSWRALRRTAATNEVEAFLNEFGSLLVDYMDKAVRDPREFEAYRAYRRGGADLGERPALL